MISRKKSSAFRQSSKNQSTSIFRCLTERSIFVAMLFILGNHWFMAANHVIQTHDFHHNSHPFLSSFSTSRNPLRSAIKISPGAASFPYVLSPICGGCYRSFYNVTQAPCVELIETQKRQQNITSILDATKIFAREYSGCEICDPDTCWKRYFDDASLRLPSTSTKTKTTRYSTKYWRFDHAASQFTSPTTLVLPSIPSQLRISPSRFYDIESFLREAYNKTEQFSFLVEYNPGLAPIPRKMKPYLPWNAAYLLSLRVTPTNKCFSQEVIDNLPGEIWEALFKSTTNHLGLALLDHKYQMLPGYDAVLDIDAQLNFRKMALKGEPAFMDYRLFVLNDNIYLHSNADTVLVTKLMIRPKNTGRAKRERKQRMVNPSTILPQ